MKDMIPVHCCCEPGKRLGYLPRHAARGGDTVHVVVREPVSWFDDLSKVRSLLPEYATLRLRTLRQGMHNIQAFDSGHQPIEVLRTIPGWVDV